MANHGRPKKTFDSKIPIQPNKRAKRPNKPGAPTKQGSTKDIEYNSMEISLILIFMKIIEPHHQQQSLTLLYSEAH